MTKQELIDLQLQHETSYNESGGRWLWSCKCGELDTFLDWNDCHKKTRDHWAVEILRRLAASQPGGPPSPNRIADMIRAFVMHKYGDPATRQWTDDAVIEFIQWANQFFRPSAPSPQPKCPKCQKEMVADSTGFIICMTCDVFGGVAPSGSAGPEPTYVPNCINCIETASVLDLIAQKASPDSIRTAIISVSTGIKSSISGLGDPPAEPSAEAKGREAILLEAASMVCGYCADSELWNKATKGQYPEWWHQLSGKPNSVRNKCSAWAIHHRIETEKANA